MSDWCFGLDHFSPLGFGQFCLGQPETLIFSWRLLVFKSRNLGDHGSPAMILDHVGRALLIMSLILAWSVSLGLFYSDQISLGTVTYA